jgi:hypothetical protein
VYVHTTATSPFGIILITAKSLKHRRIPSTALPHLTKPRGESETQKHWRSETIEQQSHAPTPGIRMQKKVSHGNDNNDIMVD